MREPGARRREPAVLQNPRPAAGSVEPVQRRDLAVHRGDGRGQWPTIFGDGEQTRDFTFVANAEAANLAAMRHPEPLGGEVSDVGTGRRIRLLDLVVALNRIYVTDLEPVFQPPRPGDVRDSLASLDRISRGLGYRPLVPFEAGLRHTVEASR